MLIATVIETAVKINDGEVMESFSHAALANDNASRGNHPRNFLATRASLARAAAPPHNDQVRITSATNSPQ
jgi:hypothetical protein